MRSSRTAQRPGIRTLAWIALIAVLTGAGVLIEALSPRAAWAQAELFVTNFLGDSVTAYSRTANGNVAPLRVLSGADTRLQGPAGLAVDTVNNELLVANFSAITVYTLTASGNTSPLRAISGVDTKLSQPIGLVVDTMHNEILVANFDSITVYGRTADGNVAPLRTIRGPSTGLLSPAGLALDMVNDEILVANIGSTTASNSSITAYSRTADGDVAPLRAPISGADTKLAQPIGLVVVGDEVVVANESSITVYSRTASGNVAPVRTVSGDLTELDHPLGLGMDTANDELLVANLGSAVPPLPGAVTVYSRKADGNVAPLRVIKGAATELNVPAFPIVATTCPSTFDLDFGGDTYARCFRNLLRGDEMVAGLDVGRAEPKHTALNVKGTSGSTPTTWLSVYDATPTDPTPGPTFGAQTLCADVLIVPFNNTKGAGLVALLNEGPGKRGLALVIYEAGNSDTLFLAAMDGDPTPKGKKGKTTLGKMTTLGSVPLVERLPQGGLNPQGGISGKRWYRLVMTVDPATPTITGKVFRHSTPTDPNSVLGTQVGKTLTYSPAALPDGVTSPGENGIVASSISAVLSVSVTNFSNSPSQCGP